MDRDEEARTHFRFRSLPYQWGLTWKQLSDWPRQPSCPYRSFARATSAELIQAQSVISTDKKIELVNLPFVLGFEMDAASDGVECGIILQNYGFLERADRLSVCK